jgi:tripartite-type tricarboxylate transporter receptor subunit TctC
MEHATTRGLAQAFTLAALCALMPMAASAQQYPSRPIKLIVPFPAGGPIDTIARVVGDKLPSLLGQPIVVENRSGAGGVTGTAIVARAEPDGYTFAISSAGALAINLSLQDRMPYHPLKDLRLLSLVAETPELLVVNRDLPANTVADLIALSKTRPGKMNFGSTGVGSMSHLSSELFKLASGIDIVHVPYSGAAPAVNDMLGGHIQMIFADIQVLVGSVQAGQLRALGIGSRTRSPVLPDVPTMIEVGLPQVEVNQWYGAVAPPGLPESIAAKLGGAIIEAMRSAEVKTKLAPLGAVIIASTPDQFADYVKVEIDKWAKAIATSGLKAK